MTILDEIADRISCQRYEGYLSTRCIFHDDHTPSLLIFPDWYHCLSCGARGKTSKLLATLDGTVTKKSQSPLKPHLWGRIEQDIDLDDIVYQAHQTLSKNPDKGYYLKQRGIWAQIDNLKLGFLEGWYIFPVLDSKKNTIGIVARAGPVAQEFYNIRYMTPKGQKPLLYVPNRKLLEATTKVVMVYGIIDAITLSMVGIPAITGTVGHNTPPEIFDEIRKKIYICPDGDGADEKSARELLPKLGWRGKLIFLEYPQGTKDCNELYCKYGKDVLLSTLKRSIEL